MTKRVLINYAWNAERGETKWLFWLKKALELQGMSVTISALKEVEGTAWFKDIKNIYSITDENVHFVEHDPGCLTILKYIEFLNQKNVQNTTLLVAGTYAQGGQIRNTFLEGPNQITVENSERSINADLAGFDAKIVVLYSADAEALPAQEHPALERPVSRYKNRPTILSDLKRALGVR